MTFRLNRQILFLFRHLFRQPQVYPAIYSAIKPPAFVNLLLIKLFYSAKEKIYSATPFFAILNKESAIFAVRHLNINPFYK